MGEKTEFENVDEYIALQPAAAQQALRRVREIVRKALPKAEEAISYKIPAYRQHNRVVLFFAGWKKHYSLYPATPHVQAELKDELAPYEVSTGTIRFPLSEPVPAKLIARIAKLRAAEVAGSQERKPAPLAKE